jgi:3-hydroxyacyl-[acyl-carrier-protein] dehydratase
VSTTVRSGAEIVAEAEIIFAHVTAAQLPSGMTDSKFVFTGELRHLLSTAEAASKGGG